MARGGRVKRADFAFAQCQHRNIVQTIFDLADIGVQYARSGGECLLGQVSLLPVLTESRPQTLQRGVLRA